jgi:hypothetical protein
MVHLSYAKVYTVVLGFWSLVRCHAASIDDCPGYKAINVQNGAGKLTADLHIAGDSCNVYGTDLHNLRLLVEYQTSLCNQILPSERRPDFL